MVIPVVLCGGSGSRLWPLSRTNQPKQFISVTSDKNLFSETIERIDTISQNLNLGELIVVASDKHKFYLNRTFSDKGIKPTTILEPTSKNPAAAIGLAAIEARSKDPEAILLVLPSDHAIDNTDVFCSSLKSAITAAKLGYLVTFGVEITEPATGFGYIEVGEELLDDVKLINNFHEKPDIETATKYMESGGYFWNSGIFVFDVNVLIEELKKYQPDLLKSLLTIHAKSKHDENNLLLDKVELEQCKDISFDYAIMEVTKKAALVPLNTQWNDLGSWESVYEISKKDDNNNVVSGDVILRDVKNSLVKSSNRLVVGIGLQNIAIIETSDAILALSLDSSQSVKDVVSLLKGANRSEVIDPSVVYRPWGSYESLVRGARFQVKRIVVEPSQQLSLQMHHHRAEHWIVVKGTATVQISDTTKIVTENQSVYIPVGIQHRLSNPGKIPLIVIEVQSGSYLGEDDIVRFEDMYSRDVSLR